MMPIHQRFTYTVDKTWDGHDIHHKRVVLSLSRDDSNYLTLAVQAPFYDDPEAPAEKIGEATPKLWDYEVVEAFFLSDAEKYLEVELCPHGQHLVLMLNGRRNIIKDQLPIKFSSKIILGEWIGEARIPLEYFPPKVTKFNAYAIHGSGQERQYECYMSVPGEQPDFHRLQFFDEIDFASLVPENHQFTYKSAHWEI